MSILKVKGLVIKEINVGESDKIVTLLTIKNGKLQASARSARRPGNKLSAGVQLFCYSDFVLFKGKSMYSINQCQVIESFYGIRSSIENLAYANYFIELASIVTEEDHSNKSLLRLVLNTIYLLANSQKAPELLKAVYELRLMCIIGYAPNLLGCTTCGELCDEVYFSGEDGGIICCKCSLNEPSIPKKSLTEATLLTMRHIIYSELNKLFSFEISQEVLNQLSSITEAYTKTHIGQQFKSLEYLNKITKA
jgi:DNA repair protein RecO (recombination protein O)